MVETCVYCRTNNALFDIKVGDQYIICCRDCFYTIYIKCQHCGVTATKASEPTFSTLHVPSGTRFVCAKCLPKYKLCPGCSMHFVGTSIACSACIKYTKFAKVQYKSSIAAPTDGRLNNRYFSVELELLDNKGLYASNRFPSLWKPCNDGSLSPGGIELTNTIPFFGQQAIISIKDICGFYKNLHRIDSSCGYHLHLDCSNESEDIIEKFARFCIQIQDSASTLVNVIRRIQFNSSKSSIAPSYCRRLPNNFMNDISLDDYVYCILDSYCKNDKKAYGDKYRQPRYYWWNFHSYFYRKTVECRLYQGTMNAREIICWAELWIKLFDWVKSGGEAQNDGDVLDYARLAGVNDLTIRYYRIKRNRQQSIVKPAQNSPVDIPF